VRVSPAVSFGTALQGGGLFDRIGPSLPMPLVAPMRLLRIPEPFDHLDFIFEPKLDGFRALAHVRGHRCELVSRNGHVFKLWPQLA
jgi:ATP-dependent DNA ligase